MKLQVLQDKLSKAVSTASRFASPKAQLPVLGNILLKASKNKLLVNATNLELSISISVGAKIESEGELTVPAKVFSEIIGNLNPGTVVLESDKESLIVQSENFKGNVAGMNSSDFPKIPESIGAEKIEIKAEDWDSVFDKVLFSVSVDDTRPALTGVLFVFKEGSIDFVSTDGFRLSRKSLSVAGMKPGKSIIVPRSVLSEVGRVGDGELVTMSFDAENGQIVAELGDTVLASRLISAGYPDYEKIIPGASEFSVNVDRGELLKAIKIAGVYGRESANVIKLLFDKDKVQILAESKTLGKEESSIDAKVDGEVMKSAIAFNFKFIEDFIGVCSDSVSMNFTNQDAAGVFSDTKDKDFLHLIMPVKIQV